MESTNNKKIEKRNKIINALDYNKNGEIDIEDIIVLGMRVPGVKVDRKEF